MARHQKIKLSEVKEKNHKSVQDLPNLYRIKKDDRELLLVGISHTNSEYNPQISKVEKIIYTESPDIVLGEIDRSLLESKKGINNIFNHILYGKDSRGNLINDYGLINFAFYMAFEIGKPFEGIEASLAMKIDYLIQEGYTIDEIFFYFGLVQLKQSMRMNKKSHKEAEKVFQNISKHFKKVFPKYDSSLNHFFKLYGMKLAEGLNDQEIIDHYLSNKKKENEMINKLDQYRDYAMIDQIIHYTNKFNKVIVVTGDNHAKRIHKALETAQK